MTHPPYDLQKRYASPRRLLNSLLSVAAVVVTLLALVPLFSVLYMLFAEGAGHIQWSYFWGRSPAPGSPIPGFPVGFGNALEGTFVMVGLGSLLSIPFGILAAIYMAEFAPTHPLTTAARFAAKLLTGLPSILAGVFAFAVVVKTLGHASDYAGAVGLALLMLPTVILTAEEALRQVPSKMREAAIGMGATQTQVALRVVVPTAWPGMLTGVLLAVARAAGETAPLLFTAQFSYFWLNLNLNQATASMAVFIYNNAGSQYDHLVQLAWVASWVLVMLILVLNLTARWLGRRRV